LFFVIGLKDYYTGEIARDGFKAGRFTTYKSDFERTMIVVEGDGIDEETGLPYVKSGGAIDVKIWPSKYGVFSGAQVIKTQSGLRKAGDLCSRGGSLDFCSNTYRCLEEDPDNCVTGFKCYGGKIIESYRIGEWVPGSYSVKVCEATDGCNECDAVFSEFLVV